jgi:hypothetical protein
MADSAVQREEYQHSDYYYEKFQNAARVFNEVLPHDDTYEEPYEDAYEPQQEQPQEQLKRQRVSKVSVLGFFLFAMFAGIYLFLNTQLTVAMTELYATRPLFADVMPSGETTRSVGLATRRDELIARTKELRVEFERTFDLGAVEAYAIERLGMVNAPRSAGTTGVGVSDRAVIPSGAEDGMGFFRTLLEYFTDR